MCCQRFSEVSTIQADELGYPYDGTVLRLCGLVHVYRKEAHVHSVCWGFEVCGGVFNCAVGVHVCVCVWWLIDQCVHVTALTLTSPPPTASQIL